MKYSNSNLQGIKNSFFDKTGVQLPVDKKSQRQSNNVTQSFAFMTAGLVAIIVLSVAGLQIFSNNGGNDIVLNMPKVSSNPSDETPTTNSPIAEYTSLYQQNNDMVGYIKIDGAKIDYPVLQTEDNEYYLNNDFNKEASRGGWIFADYRNRFDELNTSGNTILYGHNITTGHYFGNLPRYYNTTIYDSLSFYKDNPVIKFDTLYEKSDWKVFGVVLFNTQEEYGEVYEYWNKLDFTDKDDFNNYVLEIMDRSVLFTDVDLEYGDKLLTLSTDYWPYGVDIDTRLVVFARKVRDGEGSQVDVNKAVHNTGVLRFTEEAKRLGDSWNDRVWDTSYLKGYDDNIYNICPCVFSAIMR